MGGHCFAFFRYAIVVRIHISNNFVSQYEVRHAILHSYTEWIVTAGLARERIHLIFQAIAIGVAQHVKPAIVTTREQTTIGRILDVVETGQPDRQFSYCEPRYQYLKCWICADRYGGNQKQPGTDQGAQGNHF